MAAAAEAAPLSGYELCARLHETATQLVLYATGGGSQAISALLTTPGASATVLEASVPYATAATDELLGGPPSESYCSAAVASQLAFRAYQRAAELTQPGTPIIGLSCTAALRSNRPKRGEHRVYMACHQGFTSHVYSITLHKGSRTRLEEEALVAAALVSVAARHGGVDSAEIQAYPSFPGITDGDVVHLPDAPAAADAESCCGPAAIRRAVEMLLGAEAVLPERSAVRCVEVSGPADARRVVIDAPRRGAVLLPGAFNPLHDGHTALLTAAARRMERGADCTAAEICIRNADKGVISADEVMGRLEAFAAQGVTVMLTNATLFTHKAELFHGAALVLGWDTAARVVMPKYYNDSDTEMALAFAAIKAAGCRIVVGGRVDAKTNRYLTLDDLEVPEVLQSMGLFVGLSEGDFRVDVSSTELRNAKNGAQGA